MLTVLINILNTGILFYFCYKCVKNKIDSSLLWISISSLYFINIPLLYDSILSLFQTNYEYSIIQANENWVNGTFKSIYIISISSLVFNLLFYASYFLTISPRKVMKLNKRINVSNNIQLNVIPWWLCILVCYSSFFLFLFNNGISNISNLGTAEWYSGRINNSIINFLSSFLLSLSSFTVFKALVEKKVWTGMICIIPLLLVEYITESRALIISSAFYFLFFVIINTKTMTLYRMLTILIIAFLLSVLLTFWRGGLGLFYPNSKDVSYSDLFYAYSISEIISTHGTNSLRLILTGFYRIEAYDITRAIADYKIKMGWGSLHPTILGWAFVDLGHYYGILALYFGFLLGICDRIRLSCKPIVNLIFLSFVFSFTTIAIRGSVQYAYALFIYAFFILIIYRIIVKINNPKKKFKLIKNNKL